jgi:hypothetical protein
MTQALYAHMNNKTIIKKRVGVLIPAISPSCPSPFPRDPCSSDML